MSQCYVMKKLYVIELYKLPYLSHIYARTESRIQTLAHLSIVKEPHELRVRTIYNKLSLYPLSSSLLFEFRYFSKS